MFGYGSGGNCWLAEYADVTKDRLHGKIVGNLPDGRSMQGSVTLERADDATFKRLLKGFADGEEIAEAVTFCRKKKE